MYPRSTCKIGTPKLLSHPPPHTQCNRGTYTNSNHSDANNTAVPNFIHSLKAPAITAGVKVVRSI